MRADIHGGPEQKLQSEAGYIDARPQTDSSTKTSCNARPDHTFGSKTEMAALERHVRCILKSRHRQAIPACPFPARNRHGLNHPLSAQPFPPLQSVLINQPLPRPFPLPPPHRPHPPPPPPPTPPL